MSFPNPNEKYSYKDYLSWDEEKRWEIIDGVPYMQSAPSRIHQKVSMELSTQFAVYLKNKICQVYAAPFSVILDEENDDDNKIKNVVEPDISIICDKTKLNKNGCKGSPDMIIEIVSPSSVKMDKIYKFNKYEQAKVKEYWIVEPDSSLISVFTLQPNGRYGRPDIYTEEDKIKVSIFDDLEIHLTSVFDE